MVLIIMNPKTLKKSARRILHGGDGADYYFYYANDTDDDNEVALVGDGLIMVITLPTRHLLNYFYYSADDTDGYGNYRYYR